MSGALAPAPFGVPVPVDPEAIERQLAALWQGGPEPEPEGPGVRACACNLVVLAPDAAHAAAARPILVDVSRWHPHRGVIAFVDDTAAADVDFAAWVSAHCVLASGGSGEVCCETIVLGVRPAALRELPDLLGSLLVPDLPVFACAPSVPRLEARAFERIAPVADLLIVDSHDWKRDAARRHRLLELLLAPPDGVAVRDLNWSRLTSWRELTAQLFDTPAARPQLDDVVEVEIARDIETAGNLPTRTLLLTGWLASRLGWKLLGARRRGATWLSRWQGARGEITVRFTGSPAAPLREPGIRAIRLASGSAGSFAVTRDASSGLMTATATLGDVLLCHSVPEEAADVASLLVRELSIDGEDPSFRAALAAALELERGFSQ